MHDHMYSDGLGAAAGCTPERSSLGGGVPSVGNAGFVGRVIQLAAGSNMMKVKIKKKKPTQLSTLNHTHDTAPQRDSSTHHTPLHHSKVHPPHAAGWRTKSKMTQLEPWIKK